MKKTIFRSIAEMLCLGKVDNVKLPTSQIDSRKLSVDEIKQHIVEEFGKAKKASDEKVEEPEKGWGDSQLSMQVDWMKNLNLKEFFGRKKRKK